jgi:hypothetical protein
MNQTDPFASWIYTQITFGNIVTMMSFATSLGYTLHRLKTLEVQMGHIERWQDDHVARSDATYERKDVSAEVLRNINFKLGATHEQLADIRRRLDHMKCESIHDRRSD